MRGWSFLLLAVSVVAGELTKQDVPFIRNRTFVTRCGSNNAEVDNETKPKVCVPGTRTKMDCNDCWCNEDGTAQACTLMMCLPNIPDVTLRPRETRQIKTCQPGQTKQVDCNTCECVGAGTGWVCTMAYCYHPESDNPGIRFRRQSVETVCQPGEHKMEACNRCTCAADGSGWGCTRMECIPDRPKRSATELDSHTSPTDFNECRWCANAQESFKPHCVATFCGMVHSRD